jgi:hypothetical protein
MKKLLKKAIIRSMLNSTERVVISVSCKKMVDSMDNSLNNGQTFSDHEKVAYETLKKVLDKIE